MDWQSSERLASVLDFPDLFKGETLGASISIAHPFQSMLLREPFHVASSQGDTLPPTPSLPPSLESESLVGSLFFETSPILRKDNMRPHFCHRGCDFLSCRVSLRCWDPDAPQSSHHALSIFLFIVLITFLINMILRQVIHPSVNPKPSSPIPNLKIYRLREIPN